MGLFSASMIWRSRLVSFGNSNNFFLYCRLWTTISIEYHCFRPGISL